MDSQIADMQDNPITVTHLLIQNLNIISLETMKNLSVCPLHNYLLFCVGEISIEISNDENTENTLLLRFF